MIRKRIWLLAAIAGLLSAPNLAADKWWYGRYVDQDFHSCEPFNDGEVRYDATEVNTTDVWCSITRKTPVKEMNAVILNLECGNDAPETFQSREIVMHLGRGKMAIYSTDRQNNNHFRMLRKCSD